MTASFLEKRSPSPAAKGSRLTAPGLWIIAITFIAYLPALSGGFIWDDDDYVSNNPTLRNLTGLGRIWFEFGATRQYYPLVYSTFWTEYHLWGQSPIGYHVVNVLLHGLAAVLLWKVLARLKIPGATLAAAIFALHPVHVESVAWITERKNVLSGVFYFTALLTYLRFIDITPQPSAQNAATVRPTGWRRTYLASIALFACALLSKSVACTLPAAILIILWWKRGRIRASDVWPLVPMFVLGLVFGLVTAWLERTHVGAGGPEWARSFTARFINAGMALWFYVSKTFWPHPLIFVYPQWRIDPSQIRQYIPAASALVLVVALWLLRKRIGRGPCAAALFFGGTLFPALGFFNVYYAIRYAPVADHFQYLADVGPIMLFAAAVVLCADNIMLDKTLRRTGAAVLLVVLGVLTWRQCGDYRDLESLWRNTLQKNPDAGIAHLNLGTILQKKGNFEEAASHYRRTLAVDIPDAKAYFNLGTVLQNLDRTDEAVANFREALKLQPNYPKCLVNLGIALQQKGAILEAVQCYEKAVALQPNYALAHANLGAALEQAGRLLEAKLHYEEALRLNPQDSSTKKQLDDLRARISTGG